MASSSASVGSPVSVQAAYDVFLSFRGEDTRHSFTDHLFQALVRAGLRTFRDNDEIHRGLELKPEIERAIIQSRASIVVLSENYANSRWCLDELVLILDQRRNLNHFVLPLFYHVNPSDVRNQRGSCAIEVSKWTEVNVNRWKAALTEVANLTGMVVSGSETEFILKVVETIDSKLNMKLVSIPTHLTGMETRAEVINTWLKDEQSSSNVVAICGMGGSGKTTMAQHIYNSNKLYFEEIVAWDSVFLEEIGKHYRKPDGLVGLQKQLLTNLLGGKNTMISCVSEGASKINELLQMKRVLIVLDDIDDQDELSSLLGTKAFPTQSKIIITTRLRDIDAWFGSISWRCWVHELELLDDYESLKLLCFHAFGSKIPMEGFEDLAIQLAQYCEGNPLALKVLGSSLFVSAKDPYQRNNIIEIWRSRINSLNSFKGDIDRKIQSVLQKSFDSLPLVSHKELFLHIACFFVGETKEYVVKILENDWYAKSGITTLINRCLLTVSPTDKIVMHQLLQDMGRKMIYNESRDPNERSRVWCSDEAYHVLKERDGSNTIEGLSLDTRKLKKRTEPLALATNTLVKMKNLKLLQLKYVDLFGTYNSFPELRWLRWHGSHLKTIPFGLLMGSLVALDMSYGDLENFESAMVLPSLKILTLKSCYKLVGIFNFHQLPNLETLNLWGCINLTNVCRTIGDLESLAVLDLTGCNKLWKPSRIKKYINRLERLKASLIGGEIPEQLLFSLPHSLKYLCMDYCNLEYNNDFCVVFHPRSFFYLSLFSNLFESLPNNIDLNMLRILNLNSCLNLKSLLCIPSMLEELYTHWCTSLERITFKSARYKLRKFGYEGCFKLSEVQGLFKLESISKLDEADLGLMKWIKAYEDCKVDLIGDDITKGRIWDIQMLCEYGIRSTYLQGRKHPCLKSEYMSSNRFLSFHVPLCPNNRSIQGLNVTALYRSLGDDKDSWVLMVKVSIITKGLTWIYNPVVYCKPRVNEIAVWLSYWPIGSMLSAGDEVKVCIIVEKGLKVSECGASIVYMDGRIEKEKNLGNCAKREEVIGGDLSEFEVATGEYYLGRRDLYHSKTSYYVYKLFGHTIDYTESQGWKKSRQSTYFKGVRQGLDILKELIHRTVVLGVSFNSESETEKIEKAVLRLAGVESVCIKKDAGRLIVVGHVDPISIVTCVREFEKMVVILNIQPSAQSNMLEHNFRHATS